MVSRSIIDHEFIDRLDGRCVQDAIDEFVLVYSD